MQLLKSAKAAHSSAKPSKSSWEVDEKFWHKIKSLEAYSIDACENDEQKKTAGLVLDYEV
ncbi:hypothetical protein OC709_02335 ['Planchonia careya' phytoplasma]|nr:hypothetical protein ['Planchonia careya' phytoplasma]MDO8030337.1 hypothetical protein ['Planchonia careya' phytoplasma]